MSIDRWMDKEDVVHVYNGILLSHRKEQNNAIYRNMDATRDYHTKWSQSERERQIPYDITYMWILKHGTNEHIYKTETASHRNQTCGCQAARREMDWEFGVGRCKLLHLEWINKVLLYSTGNHIQSPGINHSGKEYKKKNVCICTTESLCCTAETGTTL